MNKIVTIQQAVNISKKLREEGKTIVLVGGCFDILHIGHIEYLKRAKKEADFLFLLLESDSTITTLKGNNRPIHTQGERAEILISLRFVNIVVILPPLESNQYDDIIIKLKPDVIAITKKDPNIIHKKRQAKLTNAKLVEVIKRIKKKSTTKIASLLSEES